MQADLFAQDKLFRHRDNKRKIIERLFSSHVGQKFSSSYLHATYGTSVRTRISEINRGHSDIVIKNRTEFVQGREESCYWSEMR